MSDVNPYREYITDWNIKYPLDRWWREKFKVAIFSDEHKRATFLDMRLQYEEECLYNEVRKPKEGVEVYIPGKGDYFKSLTNNQSESNLTQSLFDSIDLDEIEYDEKGNLLIKI